MRDPLSMTPPQFTQHPILFEDKDLLAISKPEGVLSHPNPGSKGEHTAFEGPYDPQRRCFKTPAGELWLLHRLDQDTSGVLLAVKSTRAAEICRKAFDERRVKKHYVALVSRRPMPPHGIWRDTLIERRSGESVRVTAVRSGAPNAFLNYKMKEFFPRLNLALLEIELLTGKTHQIRVQASFRGHPVAGDRVYGNFTVNKELRQKLELRRLFLHAWRLVLPHPSSGKPVTIDSPLPEALEDCLARTK